MLNVAVQYRAALDTLCATREHGLRAYELSANEWIITTQLHDVLKDATLFFSHNTPSLAMVIPAMDHIDTTLTNHTRPDSGLTSPISFALRLAKKTLNRYYKLCDLSATYRIAMVLHLGHKLRYFEDARWPSLWVQNARDMVHDEFDTSYVSLASRADNEEEEDTGPGSDSKQPAQSAASRSSRSNVSLASINVVSVPEVSTCANVVVACADVS
ncbi:hypothetical protein BV20DRAFT_942805 [Pilatotrama ljubarskyi]|nr:hypothetical protein BV20DRAFT_942805 [Pilatotrama ljubarskyi]